MYSYVYVLRLMPVQAHMNVDVSSMMVIYLVTVYK